MLSMTLDTTSEHAPTYNKFLRLGCHYGDDLSCLFLDAQNPKRTLEVSKAFMGFREKCYMYGDLNACNIAGRILLYQNQHDLYCNFKRHACALGHNKDQKNPLLELCTWKEPPVL